MDNSIDVVRAFWVYFLWGRDFIGLYWLILIIYRVANAQTFITVNDIRILIH